MSQDLRDLFEQERNRKYRLKDGHEARFEKKLDEALGQARTHTLRYYVAAASVLALLGLAAYLFYPSTAEQDIPITVVEGSGKGNEAKKGISLGDLSPDLMKIEQYYVANINLEHLSRKDVP